MKPRPTPLDLSPLAPVVELVGGPCDGETIHAQPGVRDYLRRAYGSRQVAVYRLPMDRLDEAHFAGYREPGR